MNERRSRDKEKTRSEVIAAAETLFARSGYSGTSLDALASASGVSKALILHHFGTKRALYAALREKLNGEYAEELAASGAGGGEGAPSGGAGLLESMLGTVLAHTRENDAFRRVGLWSYLEGVDEAGESERRITEALVAAVKAGQTAGLLRGDVDPFVLPFIVKGAVDFWIRKVELLRAIGAPSDDEALVRALATIVAAPPRGDE
jgi:TetR/AcrR family transcriptional regulator